MIMKTAHVGQVFLELWGVYSHPPLEGCQNCPLDFIGSTVTGLPHRHKISGDGEEKERGEIIIKIRLDGASLFPHRESWRHCRKYRTAIEMNKRFFLKLKTMIKQIQKIYL